MREKIIAATNAFPIKMLKIKILPKSTKYSLFALREKALIA
jgi:hypothetical protein